MIEQHVVDGVRILEAIRYLEPAMAIPSFHHERYDGTGYCQGLSGQDIPLPARLFAIVDVYDALRSERPYKKALTHPKACEIINSESGGHFDPEIVEAFLQIPLAHWEVLANVAHRE